MKTIRSRFIIIFTAFFIFTAGLAALDYFNIFILEEKIYLIQQFDDFKNDILELRRYEKNYFLTGESSHLTQMRQYLSKTGPLFSGLRNEMETVLSPAEYASCAEALAAYTDILAHDGNIGDSKGALSRQLQSNGKVLTAFSERLISEKRKRLTRVLRQMLIPPFAFSTVFVLLVLYVLQMTRVDILQPLREIQMAAEKVGKGIFKTIPRNGSTENEVSQCIAAFNNMVTEIDTRQEQLLQSRKMASIGTFTSGIAHELNNPINNISLVTESLIEDDESLTSQERRALYDDLTVQAERASDIVRNLLEFSRTDQAHFETISLEQMIDKTRTLIKNELKLNHVTFSADIPGDLPQARIDKGQLQQALLNLFLNAIQAMPEGGSLNLKIRTDPQVEGHIRIDVADTGIGIAQDQIEAVFDPFFTTKKEGEGTGLGLSVTYNIIKRHNGWITAKSQPGQGTCFSIFLPARNGV